MTRTNFLMSSLAAAAIAAGFMSIAAPAQAREAPVCLYSRSDFKECNYASMEQCMATASGIGADCQLNPGYFPDPQIRSRYTRR